MTQRSRFPAVQLAPDALRTVLHDGKARLARDLPDAVHCAHRAIEMHRDYSSSARGDERLDPAGIQRAVITNVAEHGVGPRVQDCKDRGSECVRRHDDFPARDAKGQEADVQRGRSAGAAHRITGAQPLRPALLELPAAAAGPASDPTRSKRLQRFGERLLRELRP